MSLLSRLHRLSFYSWEPPQWPDSTPLPPKIQWHRGGPHGGVAENTLEAFRMARNYGVGMIEFDVRWFDGQLLCFHDDHLERLKWWPVELSELSLRDLKRYMPVCTLNEILEDSGVPDYLNIEVKCDLGLEQKSVDSLMASVRPWLGRRPFLVSSFNPFFLLKLKQANPAIPRAQLVSWDPYPKNSLLLKSTGMIRFVDPHIIHFQREYMSEELESFWKERGIPWAVWTVNSVDETKKLLDGGALSVITDKVYFKNHHLTSI